MDNYPRQPCNVQLKKDQSYIGSSKEDCACRF